MNKRRLLRREALSAGYDLVPESMVMSALRSTGHGELLNPELFQRRCRENDNLRGPQGGFGYQMAGVGVEQPMLYFAEIHEFRDVKTGKYKCAIICFQVDDTTGEVIESTRDVQVIDGNRFAATKLIGPGATYLRGDKVRVVFFSETFADVQQTAADAVVEFQKSIKEVGNNEHGRVHTDR